MDDGDFLMEVRSSFTKYTTLIGRESGRASQRAHQLLFDSEAH